MALFAKFYHYIKGSITSLILVASCIKEKEPYSLSIRRAFIPSSRCLLISADYSQMELRIFAHMSRDHKLTKLLQNKEADVFKSIASEWLNKNVVQISEEERQLSKQICYGILYGMGPKTLAEQMGGQDITEEEALQFMSSFKTAYPEVQNYTEEVIVNCRKQVRIKVQCELDIKGFLKLF